MQRLKLNCWGGRAENHQHTCILVFLFGFLSLSLEVALLFLFQSFQNTIYMTLALAVFAYTLISFMYCSFILRNTLRKGFNLPTTIVQDECFDDFCTSSCCCY